MNYKALYEKQKELYQHALRIPRSLGEWDAGMMTWKDKRFKLESEIKDLESEPDKQLYLLARLIAELHALTPSEPEDELRVSLEKAFDAGHESGSAAEFHGGHAIHEPDFEEWYNAYLKSKINTNN